MTPTHKQLKKEQLGNRNWGIKIKPDDKNYLHFCNELTQNISTLLSGGDGYIEAARKMESLAREISSDGFDDDFIIFTAFGSDTDHIPLTKIRDKCSREFLEKSDKELEKIKDFYQERIEVSFIKLITRFSLRQ